MRFGSRTSSLICSLFTVGCQPEVRLVPSRSCHGGARSESGRCRRRTSRRSARHWHRRRVGLERRHPARGLSCKCSLRLTLRVRERRYQIVVSITQAIRKFISEPESVGYEINADQLARTSVITRSNARSVRNTTEAGEDSSSATDGSTGHYEFRVEGSLPQPALGALAQIQVVSPPMSRSPSPQTCWASLVEVVCFDVRRAFLQSLAVFFFGSVHPVVCMMMNLT